MADYKYDGLRLKSAFEYFHYCWGGFYDPDGTKKLFCFVFCFGFFFSAVRGRFDDVTRRCRMVADRERKKHSGPQKAMKR